jgi:hypothetical protein
VIRLEDPDECPPMSEARPVGSPDESARMLGCVQ